MRMEIAWNKKNKVRRFYWYNFNGTTTLFSVIKLAILHMACRGSVIPFYNVCSKGTFGQRSIETITRAFNHRKMADEGSLQFWDKVARSCWICDPKRREVYWGGWVHPWTYERIILWCKIWNMTKKPFRGNFLSTLSLNKQNKIFH